MAESLIDGLNEQQREIVFAPLSNIFVVAGAGTGKTRVLISRLVYLLEEEGLEPWQILAVTFTNKAAHEMEERLVEAMGWEQNQGVLMATFHGFCNRLLRRYHVEAKLPANFNLITNSDQENIIRRFYDDYGIERKNPDYGDFKDLELTPKQVVIRISNLKEQGMGPTISDDSLDVLLKDLANIWKNTSADELFAIAYAYYQRVCAKAGLVDFADLLIKTLDMLLNNQDIREHLQHRYRYICVDEFQDTNNIQYQLLMALKGPKNHILVVGDDDQSIYGWRGANSKNLNKICQDISDMQIYELSINYRSTQNILNVANAVISYSNDRLIQKFLINPASYELSKDYDINLLMSLPTDKVMQALNAIGAPSAANMPLEHFLRTISFRYREALIQELVNKDVLSMSDLQAREAYKWQRKDLDNNSNPKVKFVRICPSSVADGVFVEKVVKAMLKKGYKYEDIAVLYRNNSLSANIESRLNLNDIPYQVYGGLKFYERSEIADVISYLRLIANSNDNVAFSRIINTPKRGIGQTAESKLTTYADACGLSYYEALANIIHSNDKESLKLVKKFIPFYEMIESLRALVSRLSLPDLIVKLLETSGLDKYYEQLDSKERSARYGVSRKDNIVQLISNAENFCNLHENSNQELKVVSSEVIEQLMANQNLEAAPGQGVLNIKEESSFALTKEQMQANYENFIAFLSSATLAASTESTAQGTEIEKGVNLMTIHASKGLEFPVVVVIGCEEGILPSYRAEDFEEERRLAYVAFTRAIKHLFVCFAQERQRGYGHFMEDKATPSVFIKDVAQKYNDEEDKELLPYSVSRFEGF